MQTGHVATHDLTTGILNAVRDPATGGKLARLPDEQLRQVRLPRLSRPDTARRQARSPFDTPEGP
jgi:hypothetical protein